VVRRLGLQPHPEGGSYRETFRSPGRLRLPDGRTAEILVASYPEDATLIRRLAR
jgi:predicted cupin superfamily sugar epimerase